MKLCAKPGFPEVVGVETKREQLETEDLEKIAAIYRELEGCLLV
jgi:hypothetical protein